VAEQGEADGNLKHIRQSLGGLDPEEKKQLAAATVQGASDDVKSEVAAAALNAVPQESRKDLIAATIQGAPDEMKPDLAAAVVRAVPDQGKRDLVAAAVGAATDGAKREAATAAVQAVPDDMKKDVVAAAVQHASGEAKKEVADAAVSSLSEDDREELAERLLPTQSVTNKIWLIIVWTFGVVLVCATLSLIGAVFVSLFRKTDTALVQILLPVFTTIVGILAGFISGRTSAGATAR
jgi:hypothetical protein